MNQKEAKKVADVEEKVASEQPPLDIVEKSSKETEEKETDETTEKNCHTKVEEPEKDTTTLKSEVEELEKSEEQPLDIKRKKLSKPKMISPQKT